MNNLTQTDEIILDYLFNVNYQTDIITAYTIATKINCSYSNVLFRLRVLKDLGLVGKSLQGTYFMIPGIKKEYVKKMKDRRVKYEELMKQAVIKVHKNAEFAIGWSRRIQKETSIRTVPQDIIDRMKKEDTVKEIKKEEKEIDQMIAGAKDVKGK